MSCFKKSFPYCTSTIFQHFSQHAPLPRPVQKIASSWICWFDAWEKVPKKISPKWWFQKVMIYHGTIRKKSPTKQIQENGKVKT